MQRSGLVTAFLLAASIGVAANAQSTTSPVENASSVHREAIEWLDVWIPNTNDHALPRVLLIGDSITREYYPKVEKSLQGKAYVARLATSKSLGDPAYLQEVALILSEAHFDIIHFNNGMHGHDYTEAQYAADIPKLLEVLRKGAPGAKLICATTTPTRQAKQLDQVGDYTQRVVARNKAVEEVCRQENIPVDDLFPVLENHPEYYRPDGVHHVETGVDALAAHVTDSLLPLLQ